MRRLVINGIGIHVAEAGPADGPRLLYLHALGTDLRVFDDVVQRLPAGWRQVRADLRGHGQSDAGPGPASIDALAADAAGVLDALGPGASLVVGLSIGGQVAMALAAARADLVAGLVLLATAPRIGSPEAWDARIAAVRTGGMTAVADGLMERWFSDTFRRDRHDVVAAWRRVLLATPVEGYVAGCAALRDADLGPAARRIAVPTRFAVGSEDRATPPDLVRAAAAVVAGAEVTVVPGAGHLPPVERPEVVADLILRQFPETALART